MNQKSLSAVVLMPLVAASGSKTTGSGVDIGATYANVGRREFRVRLTGFIGANTTALAASIQENTTSAAAGFTDIASSTATITTSGGADVFITTNKRYLRAILTPAGTTASAQGHVEVYLENRAS
jgi:hypothetical protein